jgi:hypothetical protein
VSHACRWFWCFIGTSPKNAMYSAQKRFTCSCYISVSTQYDGKINCGVKLLYISNHRQQLLAFEAVVVEIYFPNFPCNLPAGASHDFGCCLASSCYHLRLFRHNNPAAALFLRYHCNALRASEFCGLGQAWTNSYMPWSNHRSGKFKCRIACIW